MQHDDQQVTLGEVYRICQDIRDTVRAQNGRVRKLEDDAIRIKTLWSAVALGLGFLGSYLKSKLGL